MVARYDAGELADLICAAFPGPVRWTPAFGYDALKARMARVIWFFPQLESGRFLKIACAELASLVLWLQDAVQLEPPARKRRAIYAAVTAFAARFSLGPKTNPHPPDENYLRSSFEQHLASGSVDSIAAFLRYHWAWQGQQSKSQ